MSKSRNKRVKLVEAANDLWAKARTNAFAHKAAYERNLVTSRMISKLSISSGLVSIISILFAYLVNQPDFNGTVLDSNGAEVSSDAIILILKDFGIESEHVDKIFKGYIALYLTIISIVSSVFSLLSTIAGSVGAYASLANEHEILQSFCLDVSQKVRPLKKDRPTLSTKEILRALTNLEEQFRLIKMRGSEPKDKDFIEAHRLLRERHHSRISKLSFWWSNFIYMQVPAQTNSKEVTNSTNHTD